MRQLCLCVLYLCCSRLGAAHIPTPALTVDALDKQHQQFNLIVQHIVKADGVDYALLKSNYKTQLDVYRKQLASAREPKQDAERMAFYINAYNALTLALVLELLPKDQQQWPAWSVTKVRNFWKQYTFNIHGQWMSLDHIEHQLLRPMGDPRVHFAVNCASKSCPPLLNAAYTTTQLEQQLQSQTRAFMKSPYHLRLTDNTLNVNPILKWFAADFKTAGGVSAYLLKQAQRDEIKTYLSNKGSLSYFKYDWLLNITSADQ